MNSVGLKEGDGNFLYDKEKIKDRWYCYCKALFKEKAGKMDRSEWESISCEQEPLVLKSEIRSAIKKMKCQKQCMHGGFSLQVHGSSIISCTNGGYISVVFTSGLGLE